MTLTWSSNLCTGLDWQDRQHEELFAQINTLLDAMHRENTPESINALFHFLEDYINHHFKDEECYMLDHGFKGYRGHKLAHEGFILRFSQLKATFAAEGGSPALAQKTQNWLVSWLMTHIAGLDKELARKPMAVELVD